MLLEKYSLKLFKYWFAGYIIGVFLAVAFVSLQNFLWYDYDNYEQARYDFYLWISDRKIKLSDLALLPPPNLRGINYLMHIAKGENRSVADALAQRIRVFCIVTTKPKHYEIQSLLIRNTWGQRCDGLIFMSTIADESLPLVFLNTSKDDPWGRFKEMSQYVYNHHADEADWFIIVEDDTYIIMENLKYMLNDYSSSEASFFGYMRDGDTDKAPLSKAGYVLSRATLRAIVDWGPYFCKSVSPEEYHLSECLQKLKIKIVDTHDSAGHARFFPYNPTQLHRSLTGASDFAISFHKINEHFVYVMEFVVYHLRAYGIVANYSVPEPYHSPTSVGHLHSRKSKNKTRNPRVVEVIIEE